MSKLELKRKHELKILEITYPFQLELNSISFEIGALEKLTSNKFNEMNEKEKAYCKLWLIKSFPELFLGLGSLEVGK